MAKVKGHAVDKPTERETMIHATLHLENGDTDLKIFEFNIPATIGRSKIADVTIPHPLISRKHCELTEANDGRVALRDLDSLNGTYVGKVRIKQMMLQPNDLITIGPYTYRIEYEPATTEEEQTERLSNGNTQEAQRAANQDNAANDTFQAPQSPFSAASMPGIQDDGSSQANPLSAASEPMGIPEFGNKKVPPISSDDEALQNFFKNLP